ncbi:mechanosensitive ion channel domain-containing protein [uncultured Tateyamaria sp.]|uniref:mechanosensitive ion channel family protein n=1 Tax=uncultured Tateyamaria sp. TaxID=455651 RepID=UPI002631D547|nr:mechanosensitive ion channel domain-containing protein [uncultured Tateyamaria sp.]
MSNHTDSTGNEIADALNSAAEAAALGESQDGETLLEVVASLALLLLEHAQTLLSSLLRPWVAYQIGIAILVFVAALLLRRTLGPRIREWMGTREGWPKWRMRVLVVVYQRLRAIFFVVLIWMVVWIMREVTWPSRSYVLGLIATLATAWLLVVFATRLIRSIFLRRTVRYGAYIYVTLYVLGLVDEAAEVLDAAAFSIGEFRISALLIVQGVVVVGCLLALARFVTATTSGRIQANEDISPSMRVLIVKVVQIGFYAIAFYAGVRALGIDLTGLAVLSGAIGVGLGFGLQKVVSNLVSGVIILLDKSIKPGDVISLGDTFGWIQTLGARYASVVTRDGREYLIPNEDLITGQVVNWSHSNDFVRLDIYFGTSYGCDPHKVRKLAIEAAKEVERVLSSRPPVCHIVGFGDSSVDYILRFWITDPTGGLTNIRGNVYLALWDAFKENNISIPFPQREVRLLGEDDGP